MEEFIFILKNHDLNRIQSEAIVYDQIKKWLGHDKLDEFYDDVFYAIKKDYRDEDFCDEKLFNLLYDAERYYHYQIEITGAYSQCHYSNRFNK